MARKLETYKDIVRARCRPVLFPNRWPEALSAIGINFALNWAEARTLRVALWGECSKGEGVIDKKTFINGTLALASFQAILK